MKVTLTDEELYSKGQQGILNIIYRHTQKLYPRPQIVPVRVWEEYEDLEKAEEAYLDFVKKNYKETSPVYIEAEALKKKWKEYRLYKKTEKEEESNLLEEGKNRVREYFKKHLTEEKMAYIEEISPTKITEVQRLFDILNMFFLYEVKFSNLALLKDCLEEERTK